MAGVELATAYVNLVVSGKDISKGVKSQFSTVERDAAATGRSVGKSLSNGVDTRKAQTSVGKLGKSFDTLKGKVGGVVSQYKGLAAIGAVAGGVKIMSDSIAAASEAEQAIGGVDAVFGKSAANVKKNAESAATAVGLTKTEYMGLSTVLASGLKNKGIKDFASQSQDLVKKGADLASMFGGTTKEAVEALASAMRGEMDPIERYGVTLNADAVAAQAV